MRLQIGNRRLAIAALLLLLLAAVGFGTWRWWGGGGSTPSDPIPPPHDLFVRMHPARSIELVWKFDPRREREVERFHVRIFEGVEDLATIAVERGQRSYVDSTHARPGRTIDYVVAAEDAAGERYYSEVLSFAMPDLDGAPPPAPKDVTAVWRTLHGRPIVEVRWSGGDPSRVSGYRIYADDEREGAMQPRHDPLKPLKETVAAFDAANRDDRTIALEIVAVDSRMWESESVRASVQAKAVIEVAPSSVTASQSSPPESAMVLRWEYERLADLVGFRVYDHGLEVANETTLNAGARTYRDAAVLDRWTYGFEVRAVFSDGRVSPPGRSAPVDGVQPEQDRRPAAPTGLAAEWAVSDQAPVVRVTWHRESRWQDVAAYELSVKAPGSDAFGPVGPAFSSLPPAPGPQDEAFRMQYDYRPPARSGSIAFRLTAVDRSGRRSAAAETEVVAAARMLMPARLVDFREANNGSLILIWRYPDSPVVRGFRIYHDGTLVADEERIGRALRQWTLPAPEMRRHHFEIEAVAADGTASPRGTGIDYDRIR
jgi:hypothetical protein